MMKTLSIGVLVFMLAGCVSSGPQVAPIDELRAQFIAAGGDCADATAFELDAALESIRCVNGAVLHTVESDADRSAIVDYYLESERVRARTHVMLGAERWIIVDKIATIVTVMPKLGGIIQGRNGANP
ncbi:MAG: hypothetical protein ACOYNK_01595 [Microbacteriaceae bacterium]